MTIYMTRRPSGGPKTREKSATRQARAQTKAQFVMRTDAPAAPVAPSITSPADVALLLGAEMSALVQEQVRILLLDTKHRVRACHLIYQGTVSSASIRVAEIVRPAVLTNMPAILMVHNHPSGDPAPSPEDIHSTHRIADAAALLDIDLVDHVILGAAGRYHSLKEAGLLRAQTPIGIAP